MKRVRLILYGVVCALGTARGGELVMDTPSDDRWHYPFNFTPGRRATASCFGSTADSNFATFNDRDGIFLIAWRTDEELCAGLAPGAYDIRSVRVTLTGAVCSICPPADWIVDLTPDEWFNMDYPITDTDPGQPLELYGVGFGPERASETWTETSLYVGGDDQSYSQRDPFPFVFDTDGSLLRVEDSVKERFTPTPWAIGVPVGYTPGRQAAPFPVHFDVNLSLSGERVRRYFQERLSAGRVFVAVASLTVTFKQALSGFPTFFTKEGAGLDPHGAAPRLTLTLVPSGDLNGTESRDLEDWSALAQCLSGPGELPGPPGLLKPEVCLCVFDLDEDGDVDLHDVSLFAQRFNGKS